jgi:glycosyltransferase 2 family protein
MNRRFALIQALVSLVALAAVVWWASKQEAPKLPSGGEALSWLALGLALYAAATLLRGERWHWILHFAHVDARRSECYALTTVGYMGNNVLPARAGEALRVVLLSGRSDASKRTVIGSIIAERLLDVVALAVIFVATVYGVLGAKVLPTDRPILAAGITFLALVALAVAVWALRRHHVFERVREWLRPLADAPRAMLAREGIALLAATFLLWTLEAGVYYAVARSVDLGISMTGALYLVALTNFVAALPAAPGSIGTFDAAVAWGANKLGAAGSAAVAYLLMLRFVLYVPITVVGFAVLVTRYGGWSRIRTALRGEREPAPAEPLSARAEPGFARSEPSAARPEPSRARAEASPTA